MKKMIKHFFNKYGYDIKKYKGFQYESTMEAGLYRHLLRGGDFSTIIDVGAFEGQWSKTALKYWGRANYLLFEPLIEKRNELLRFAKNRENIKIISAAAGNYEGMTHFNITSDLAGSGIYDNSNNSETRVVPISTIDFEVLKFNLLPPFLIKLDTHGYEKPILEGASETLKNTFLLVIEAYGFHQTKDSFLFHELCTYLYSKNFRLIDVVDVIHRNNDYAFWQCDVFFVRSDSKIFQLTEFRTELV